MKRSLPFFHASTIRTAIVTVLLTAVNFFAQAQTCDCDHIINPPADSITSVFIDGLNLGVRPGETICLNAGFYKQIRFTRLSGEPGKPVTVKNCGGLVQIGDSTNYGRWYAADIVSCNYFRLTGSGDPSNKYGIKLGKSGDSGMKMGLSTSAEIDHVEIANTGFAGILAKSDYLGNPPPNAPEMNNINIHDNYVHDTRGEGMYIGETRTPGQDFRHLEVWNNIITRTGLDLIQVANAVEDAQVHHNVFYKAGLRNVLFQNKGLQIGDNSVGRYYNNFIVGSPSNSMIIMGSGNIEVFNNYLQGAGNPGFFIDNRSVSISGAPINIYKNYLMEVNESFSFFSIFNELNPINITDNKLEGNNVLLVYGSNAGPKVTESGNTREVIERVQFMDVASDNFMLVPGSPYQGLGLIEDVSNLNNRPFIALIPDQELDYDLKKRVNVFAKDPDGDAMTLEAFNLPSFVSFTDRGDGRGIFKLAPVLSDTGVYYKVRVRVTDSKGAMNTQYFAITVTVPNGATAKTRSSKSGYSAARSNADSKALSQYGTSENSFNDINAYPNPVTDKLTIDLGLEQSAFVTVEICDLVGRSFYQKRWINASQFIDLDLNTGDMDSGLYLIKVKQDGLPLKILRLVKH